MIQEIVGRRYAQALFEAIDPPKGRGAELEAVEGILKELGRAFEQHQTFRHLMRSPRFGQEVKIKVLKALLGALGAGEPVVKFFEYLVRKNRFQYLGAISEAFSILVDDFQGKITVPVASARELGSEEQDWIRQSIESRTGRKIELQCSVRPALIGGIVIQLKEAMVDGSIRGQLEAVRKRLVEA